MNEIIYYPSLQIQAIQPLPLPASGPDNPSLAIFRCNTDIVLEWRTNAVGFVLESASEVPSANWQPATEPLQIVGDRFSITQPITVGNRYYRLSRP